MTVFQTMGRGCRTKMNTTFFITNDVLNIFSCSYFLQKNVFSEKTSKNGFLLGGRSTGRGRRTMEDHFEASCTQTITKKVRKRKKNLWRRKLVRREIFRNIEVPIENCLQQGPWVTVGPVRSHLTTKMNITFFIRN